MKCFKSFLIDLGSLFCLLNFIFLPLTLNSKDFQFQVSSFLFERFTLYIQNQFFPSAISAIDFSSDTIALNILLVSLLLLSIIITLVSKLFKIRSALLTKLFFTISPYYIGLILFKYGIEKVTLQQFATPEPNILYTPFGYLDKDILFWSTIGTSKFYNISVGMLEIFASILLFWRKTRVLGFCVALGIVLNILIINIGFDISVKTLSAFLLLVIFFNLYPFFKPLYSFFIHKKLVRINDEDNCFQFPNRRMAKLMVISSIVFFVCYPYLINAFIFDKLETDNFKRAYEVIDSDNYKRVFFHKDNFIIFQTLADEMIDYHYKIDTSLKKITLEDYQDKQFELHYKMDKDGQVELQMNNGKMLLLRSINWKNLPAMQDGVHFTIDEIR